MLGILVLVLMFSVILRGFSNLDVADQDYTEEPMYVLEPTQPEPESTESEPTEAEPAPEPDPESNPEPTEIEPTVTEPTP
ncbi:MAG: hypothetical protein OEY81_02515, partial [Candidatus Bathyarchaeota archaeon]|nr:hypothetical protein [Candidatus Bathyarchaeota archaeon]